MSSQREQFGQALIEGMACGLPAIATSSLGPAAIIEHGRTGRLTPPDDENALQQHSPKRSTTRPSAGSAATKHA